MNVECLVRAYDLNQSCTRYYLTCTCYLIRISRNVALCARDQPEEPDRQKVGKGRKKTIGEEWEMGAMKKKHKRALVICLVI